MSLRAVVPAILALAALLLAAPAQAQEPALEMSLAAGWDGVQDAGWIPYTARLDNLSDTDFVGTVRLVAEQRTAAVATWQAPIYEVRASVPRHTTGQEVTFYVRGERYFVEAVNTAGQVVRRARLTPRPSRPIFESPVTVGLLTASSQIEAELRALSGLPAVAVHRFAAAAQLPANPVILGNLGMILIAGFDSSALTSTQVEALRSYVGLGGTLGITGGADWRRTLGPLPDDLTPLRPEAEAEGPLGALAALGDRRTELTTTLSSGSLRRGRVVVSTGDGRPLVVEAPLGAGRLVELTFDPAELSAADPALARLGWAQMVFRARGTLGLYGQGLDHRLPSSFGYAGPIDATWMLPLLAAMAAVPPPPVPVVSAVLLGPAFLIGLAGLQLRLRRRPPRMFWITPLVLTLTVPPGLYAAGLAVHSGEMIDGEVQVLRPAPGGRVLSLGSHAIYASTPGDYRVLLAPGALVGRIDYAIRPMRSASLPVPGLGAVGLPGWAAADEQVRVLAGDRPQVSFTGAEAGPVLTMETASLHTADLTLEAHLRYLDGRIIGTVTNRGTKTVRGLRLLAGSRDAGKAERALFNLDLAPGASGAVDAPLLSYSPAGVEPMTSGSLSARQTAPDVVAELAAARAVQHPGEFVLVASTTPIPEVALRGGQPDLRALAAVVAPVELEESDRFPAEWSYPRLVSVMRSAQGMVDIYDFEVPPSRNLRFALESSSGRLGQLLGSVEVYDWSSGGWRQLPISAIYGTTELTSSELREGLVRIRVREVAALDGEWDLRVAAL